MNKVLISLGTNLGDRKKNLISAYMLVQKLIGDIKKQSAIYVTPPWGFDSDMDFYNSVLLVHTSLTPSDLLFKMQDIESALGRAEKIKPTYEDRLIDLDIIDFNNESLDDIKLILPHPRMHLRKFVLIPLIEICPHWQHPKLHLAALTLVNQIKDESVIHKLKE